MPCSNCSRAVGGWLAGCGTATAVICTFGLVVSAIASGNIFSLRFGGASVALLFPLFLIFLITCLLTGIPAGFVIWLSEKFRIRSVLFFGAIGAAIGVLSQNLLLRPLKPGPPIFGWLFLLAGFAAGLAYWHVAGRHAGRDGDLPGGPA